MFVGFIAIIVVLLIIVAAMSTGSTSGSGGVDQTQATKVLSEFSGLSQSFDFFKTTTTYSNYEGITVDKLVDNGIVNTADVVEIDPDGVAASGDEFNAIASKALAGVTYTVAAGTTDAEMDITLSIDEATVSESAAKAVVSTFSSKLGSTLTVVASDTASSPAGEDTLVITVK